MRVVVAGKMFFLSKNLMTQNVHGNFFSSLFSRNYSSQDSGYVIPNQNLKTFERMIEFLETGIIVEFEENSLHEISVYLLLKAARFYGYPTLSDYISKKNVPMEFLHEGNNYPEQFFNDIKLGCYSECTSKFQWARGSYDFFIKIEEHSDIYYVGIECETKSQFIKVSLNPLGSEISAEIEYQSFEKCDLHDFQPSDEYLVHIKLEYNDKDENSLVQFFVNDLKVIHLNGVKPKEKQFLSITSETQVEGKACMNYKD